MATPKLTLAQAERILGARHRHGHHTRHAPGLLRMIAPLFVGLAVNEGAAGGNLLALIENHQWHDVFSRSVPRALTGLDTATGVWNPWQALSTFYFPAYLTDLGLRWITKRFTGGKGIRAFGVRWL